MFKKKSTFHGRPQPPDPAFCTHAAYASPSLKISLSICSSTAEPAVVMEEHVVLQNPSEALWLIMTNNFMELLAPTEEL